MYNANHYLLKSACLGVSLLCFLHGAVGLAAESIETDEPSHVTVEKTETGYQLIYNDEPYYVKGAGAKMFLEELQQAGANSIRTWDAAYIKPLLDKAHKLNLTVSIGLWMEHERNGFDYSNQEAVERQFKKLKRQVTTFKDHPALLMWGIGNETEWISGTNILVYKAINDIAKMIKQVDHKHPSMSVLAELDPYGVKIQNFKKYCQDVDILGINSFGGLQSLPERLKNAGWNGPYIITEFGPVGPWEVKKTNWGAELEQTSTDKGKFFFTSYMKGIYNRPDCLGSYVFFWGHKMETTPTWFSMILRGGEKTSPCDYMQAIWSKKWPTNRCPTTEPIQSRAAGQVIRKGGQFEASIKAHDIDGDPLEYHWNVMSEKKHPGKGVETTVVKPVNNVIISTNGNTVTFKAPRESGAYRLFGYIKDGQGNVATANTPFYAR